MQYMKRHMCCSVSVAMRGAFIAPVAYLVACGFLWAAQAASVSGPPIYDSHSKSYFQLFDDNKSPGNWMAARKRARAKVFKGVAGRLAQIKSAETHEFLINTLGMRASKISTWIGLRYWCRVRLLQWGTDRPYSPSDLERFRIWHNPWSRAAGGGKTACQFTGSLKTGFAPVYYRNVNGQIRWQAVGASKYFSHYLVEFPTDGE